MAKHTKEFQLKVPKNKYNSNKGRYEPIGDFLIDGKAYCQHPADMESFDYDIEQVQFIPTGSDVKEDCTKSIKCLMLTDDIEMHEPIMKYLEYLWAKQDAEDKTTDRGQDIGNEYKAVA